MINYNNHNITGISYNNHSIKYVYGCGGNLVWSGGTGPTPPTGMKFSAVFQDSSTYSAECDSSSVITAEDYASHTSVPSSITYVEIGDCVDTIGRSAFKETALTGFSLSNSVTTIGVDSFSQCNYLTDVVLPSSITTISDYGFYYCIRLSSINIPSGVTSINAHTFHYCNKLSSCTIPNDSLLTSIGDGAFNGCLSLESLNIPNSVRTFGASAFASCYSLTNINIPNGTTAIPDSFLNGCSGLTSITIPSTVSDIGSSAFLNCKGLEYIEFKSQFAPALKSDGGATFRNTNSCPIYVPDASVEDYKTATNWSYVADRIKPISEKP